MTEREYSYIAEKKLHTWKEMCSERNIWIYGAGRGGKLLLKTSKKQNVGISGFIDKRVGLIESYEDLPVCSLNSVMPSEDFIIVSLMNYNSEIEDELKASGWSENDYAFIVEHKSKEKLILDTNNTYKLLGNIDDINSVTELNDILKYNSEAHLYDVFWRNRDIALSAGSELERKRAAVKCHILQEHFGASIPVSKSINKFYCPHGLKGIFISAGAKVGNGCTILQNVTIGSNTLLDSAGVGFPVIGENVFIGAGAQIIGNISIGDNSRIAAGATVTKSVPDNCVVAIKDSSIIQKINLDNTFYSAAYLIKNSIPKNQDKIVDRVPKRVIDEEKKKRFKNAFRITFSGDLILLEDQVKRAYIGNRYDFSPVFKYVKPYLVSSDLSIGVFEGPMGGEEKGYSTSNFADGKVLRLNYPDEFGKAVKNAGYELVTTANNHLLDAGDDGAFRTLDVMDSINLFHVGSYRSPEDKERNRVKIIEKDGLKFAILAYTFCINGYKPEDIVYSEKSYVTSIISGMEGELFEKQKKEVERDFEIANRHNPDIIIVLPHMGKEFVNYPDDFQKKWMSVFAEFGADIILGDHTHTVQPITIINIGSKNVFVAYSPGNLSNIYRDKQGDTSVLIDVYIDKKDKKVIGGSIVPLYTMAQGDGNFMAIPIYELYNNDEMRCTLSSDDMERIKKSHDIITSVALGYKIDISSIKRKYYFDYMGYMREKTLFDFCVDETMKRGVFYLNVFDKKKICFIGDSITEGTKNGGVPWYEPIESLFEDKEILNFSKGSCTVQFFLNNTSSIPYADVYIIAVGANDIRYRNSSICAMTPVEYTDRMELLRYSLKQKNRKAGFVFIAPWYSTDGDPYTTLTYNEKLCLCDKYSKALKVYCEQNDCGFIDPNIYLKSMLDRYPHRHFLIDHIHPNAKEGVCLFARAVLLG